MKQQEYFLGLDIGTGSVGWCVTDLDYNILKVNRKRTIGSVLFSTANPAKERRLVRCARRRLKRKQERIRCLQELFFDEIKKVDDGFFYRLKESPYVAEDKRTMEGSCPELPYALFVDKSYTDKEFHKEYPTIYHLRKSLMEDASAHDVRLVYLAIAHILKHRGHFLNMVNVDEDEQSSTFEELITRFMEEWKEYTDTGMDLSEEEKNSIKEILLDADKVKSEKKAELIKFFCPETVRIKSWRGF